MPISCNLQMVCLTIKYQWINFWIIIHYFLMKQKEILYFLYKRILQKQYNIPN